MKAGYWIGPLLAAGAIAFSCKLVPAADELLFSCDLSKGCTTSGHVCGYDNICRRIELDCRSSCDGGCCLDNRCVPLDGQDQTACGYGAAACSQCPGTSSCRRGVCVNLACESSWDACYQPGGNPDGGCVQGLSEARCGAFGLLCRACDNGQRCYAGTCIWPGTGQLGDPCSGPSDCGIQNGSYLDCFTTAPFPGGYCTRYCSPNFSSSCEGVCLRTAEDPNAGGICYGGCRTSADCRDGYDCVRLSTGNACIARCVSDAQCRSVEGYRTGRCGDDGRCCGGPGFSCCLGTDGLPQCLGADADGGPSQCNERGFCT
jgi:hypothetical protein